MYSLIAENIIYPLGDLALGTSVIKYYHWLQKTQWWSPEQLKELQDQKLIKLIEHTYSNVPYYRQLFDSLGLTPEDIQTTDDLKKLPILTKENIRSHFDELKATDFNKHKPVLNATGGSTGDPLQYYITKDVASITWAGMFRSWEWAGYKLGDKRATLAGSSLVPNNSPSLVTLIFKDCRIRQYQVIQEAEDALTIDVVKGKGYTDQDTHHFLSIIQSHIGDTVSITTKFVDEIPTTKAGKHRFFISKVANQ